MLGCCCISFVLCIYRHFADEQLAAEHGGMEPGGVPAALMPGSDSKPTESSAGVPHSFQHQGATEAEQVQAPPPEVWRPRVGRPWERKSLAPTVTFTKRTLESLFAWQHGSSKRYVPTVVFRCLPPGASAPVSLPPVRLHPPSRDDSVKEAPLSEGKQRVKVDGYPVPPITVREIYTALGVQQGGCGGVRFTSKGWEGRNLVMQVELMPPSSQPAGTGQHGTSAAAASRAATASPAGQAAAAPAAAQAGLAAAALPVASQPAAAAAAAEPPASSLLAAAGAAAAEPPATSLPPPPPPPPAGEAPAAAETVPAPAPAPAAAAGEAQVAAEAEPSAAPTAPPREVRAAPTLVVSSPAAFGPSPASGVPSVAGVQAATPSLAGGLSLAGPAAAAPAAAAPAAAAPAATAPLAAGAPTAAASAEALAQLIGAFAASAPQEQPHVLAPAASSAMQSLAAAAAAAAEPSRIVISAQHGWLRGEQLLELLTHPQKHGLQVGPPSAVAGSLFLTLKSNKVEDGLKWVDRRSVTLRVDGKDAVHVIYYTSSDGSLKRRTFRLVDESAANAHLQLLHYQPNEDEDGPKSGAKRKADAGRDTPGKRSRGAAGRSGGTAPAAPAGSASEAASQLAPQRSALLQAHEQQSHAPRVGRAAQQQPTRAGTPDLVDLDMPDARMAVQPPGGWRAAQQQPTRAGTPDVVDLDMPDARLAVQPPGGGRRPQQQSTRAGTPDLLERERSATPDLCDGVVAGMQAAAQAEQHYHQQGQQQGQPPTMPPLPQAPPPVQQQQQQQGGAKETVSAAAQAQRGDSVKQEPAAEQAGAAHARDQPHSAGVDLSALDRISEQFKEAVQVAAARQEAVFKKQLAAAQDETRAVESQCSTLRQQLAAAEEKLVAAREELAAVRKELAATRQQLSAAQGDIRAAHKRNASLPEIEAAARAREQPSTLAVRAAELASLNDKSELPAIVRAMRTMLSGSGVPAKDMQVFLKREIFDLQPEQAAERRAAMHLEILASSYKEGDDSGVQSWVQLTLGQQ